MKNKKYTDSQITSILKQAADGIPIPELCRSHGIATSTFYKWRSHHQGMNAEGLKQLRELTLENARLKKLYAEALLHADIIKEALAKK